MAASDGVAAEERNGVWGWSAVESALRTPLGFTEDFNQE